MNCRRYRHALTSKSRLARTRLERHREQCPSCREYFRRLKEVEARLARPAADRSDLLPPPGFSTRVMSALPERRGALAPLAWASLRLLPLTAALALTLLAWCLVATPAPSDLWAEASGDDVLTWVSGDDL